MITLDPPFLLQCEFSFPCRLTPGEYTVEFGFVDIHASETDAQEVPPGSSVDETTKILYVGPPVGRFAGDSSTD